MIRTVYRLPFRLLGIPVHLDVTFLFFLPFLAWFIGYNIEQFVPVFQLFTLESESERLQQGLMPYLLGFVAAVGLFASVVFHELAHCVVGQSYGVRIKAITLWMLGGMAQFEKIPRQPGAEAIMAIAGPISSYALGFGCWFLLHLVPPSLPEVQFVLAYLVLMNIILATFNLLPALPLDGGRVFRSLLALRMPHLQATQVAARVSKLLALLLGLFGFLTWNVFMMLIAFFIYIAVGGESQYATIAEMLHGIKVRDLMTRDVKTVRSDLAVSKLLQKMFDERHLGYPVVDPEGRMVGMVTLSDIRKHQETRGQDAEETVEKIMTTQVSTASQNASALDAFQQMSQSDFGRLAVVDGEGSLIGIISKTDLVRAIQVRMLGFHLDSEPEVQA